MEREPTPFPQLLRGAIACIIITPIVALAAFLLPMAPKSQTGLLALAGSLLCFGIGEVLNHPVQTGYNFSEETESTSHRFHHRHRNSCSLGNMLLIVAILFLFFCLGKFISF